MERAISAGAFYSGWMWADLKLKENIWKSSLPPKFFIYLSWLLFPLSSNNINHLFSIHCVPGVRISYISSNYSQRLCEVGVIAPIFSGRKIEAP